MWRDVGIVRTPAGLRSAIARLRDMRDENESVYRHSAPTEPIVALRNMLDAGLQIARAALRRRQSVGCHVIRGA
jgi:aspartate oxidase